MACEAGLSDHPADRGGRTMGGITQATYDAWRVRHELPKRPVDELALLEARELYLDDFWMPVRAPELPPRLAFCAFDAAVNHSPERAIKFLQRTLATSATEPLAQDGRFGPKTMQALERALALHGERQVLEAFLDWRLVWYERIIATDPTQAVFGDGWRRRVADLRNAIECLA